MTWSWGAQQSFCQHTTWWRVASQQIALTRPAMYVLRIVYNILILPNCQSMDFWRVLSEQILTLRCLVVLSKLQKVFVLWNDENLCASPYLVLGILRHLKINPWLLVSFWCHSAHTSPEIAIQFLHIFVLIDDHFSFCTKIDYAKKIVHFSSRWLNFSMFTVCFLEPCQEFIIDPWVNVATKQVINVELNCLMLSIYNLISYAWVVWVEFETDDFKVRTKFVVP